MTHTYTQAKVGQRSTFLRLLTQPCSNSSWPRGPWHRLVPKPGSTREGQGWLLGTGFDVQRQRSFATVFDAEAISAGPFTP